MFTSSAEGHRGPYVSLLSSLFSLAPVCATPTVPVLRRLLRPRRLLFATFDDSILRFALTALFRGLNGRPTVGLLLRPQSCFSSRLKGRVKGFTLRLICRIPRLRLVSITPFSVEPRYASLAHLSVNDPQYWDLHDGREIRAPGGTPLSEEIQRRAAGRRILGMPGYLNLHRGIGFLADMLRQEPTLRARVLVVAAGVVLPDARKASQDLVAAGGLLIDRRLDDSELESLYVASDLMWCCYAPEYDQASGIFGRAIQLGVPAIVRRGSLIDRFASGLQSPVIAMEFGDVRNGARLLMQELPARPAGPEWTRHSDLIGTWREDFVRTVGSALESGSRPAPEG